MFKRKGQKDIYYNLDFSNQLLKTLNGTKDPIQRKLLF